MASPNTAQTRECLRCRGMRRVPRVDSAQCPVCKGTGEMRFTVQFTTRDNAPHREHVSISFDELISLIGPDEVQGMIARAESGYTPYTAYWDSSFSHYATLVESEPLSS
jgi:hypothetical protein